MNHEESTMKKHGPERELCWGSTTKCKQQLSANFKRNG